MFGGLDAQNNCLNDLYRYEFGIFFIVFILFYFPLACLFYQSKATRKWVKISIMALEPEPRHSHSAVVYKDFMYIYGGFSPNGILNDIFSFSFSMLFLFFFFLLGIY